MSSDSPAAILFSTDGYELAVQNSVAIPTGTRGILLAGSDGSNSKFITIDSSARIVIAGAGSAGTPLGGVLTIQGVSGGTAINVAQSTAANLNATVTQGTAAANSGAWTVKLTDGSNNPSLLNSNPAGTEYGLVVRNIPSGTQTISGSVTVSQSTASNLNAAVVGTGTAGAPTGGVLSIQGVGGGTAVPVSGTMLSTRSTTSTLTNVAGSATNVQLLASNSNRVQSFIYNDSSSILYVKLGTTASSSSFTQRLLPQASWQVPDTYTGKIDGIWASATGNARITELTP